MIIRILAIYPNIIVFKKGYLINMKIFDYEDIQLIPNKCIVESRSECDTSIKFGPRTFKLPVVPANMQTVMNEELAQWFAENDYFISCTVLMKS